MANATLDMHAEAKGGMVSMERQLSDKEGKKLLLIIIIVIVLTLRIVVIVVTHNSRQYQFHKGLRACKISISLIPKECHGQEGRLLDLICTLLHSLTFYNFFVLCEDLSVRDLSAAYLSHIAFMLSTECEEIIYILTPYT